MGKDAYTLYIRGNCGSVTDTVEIVDLFYYNTLTSNNNHYIITSGSASLTYGNNGLTFKGTAKQDTLIKNNILTLPQDYIVELTVTSRTSASGNLAYGGFVFDKFLIDFGVKTIIYDFNPATGVFNKLLEINYQVSNGDVFKFEMKNGTMKTYINNTLIATNNISQNGLHYFRTYQDRSLTVKELKVHEL